MQWPRAGFGGYPRTGDQAETPCSWSLTDDGGRRVDDARAGLRIRRSGVQIPPGAPVFKGWRNTIEYPERISLPLAYRREIGRGGGDRSWGRFCGCGAGLGGG